MLNQVSLNPVSVLIVVLVKKVFFIKNKSLQEEAAHTGDKGLLGGTEGKRKELYY